MLGDQQTYIITNMLECLQLKNFILVKDVAIDFGDGFNVMTGETGAGKSLIVKSLALLLGAQASDDYIYPGADFAYVEAMFNVSSMAMECDDDVMIISRKIQRGRSTQNKINGELVALKQMKHVVQQLVFLASQHHVYELLNVSNHKELFDHHLGDDFQSLLADYQREYDQLMQLNQQLADIEGSADRQDQQLEELTQLIADIDAQQFSVNEEVELLAQQATIKALDDQRELVHTMSQCCDRICSDATELSQSLQLWEEVSGQSESFDTMQVISGIEDFRQTLSAKLLDIEYLASIDVADVDARLDTIFKYRFKYKVGSLVELLALSDGAKQTISEMGAHDQRLLDLKSSVASQGSRVSALAQSLSTQRHDAHQGFSFLVTDRIRQLGMVDAQFKVVIDSNDDVGPHGIDAIEFLFSANANMPPKSLRAHASGGELSRVLLALLVTNRSVLSQPLIVFDEIDVGIGGVTANFIGSELAVLSEHAQCIAVTHLAQVARCANHHFNVIKTTKDNDVCVTIFKLTKEDVSLEIQRMVGGDLVASLIK